MRKINKYHSEIEKMLLRDLEKLETTNPIILLNKLNKLSMKYDSSIIRAIVDNCIHIKDEKKVFTVYYEEEDLYIASRQDGVQAFSGTNLLLRKILSHAQVEDFEAKKVIEILKENSVI